MTIIVTMTSQLRKDAAEWAAAEAKAHFSEMIDRALAQGPQVVTRKGKPTVVVVPIEEWERRSRRPGSLADFFAASPLRGSELELERLGDLPRDVGI
jgi:prevent-host-death family protein